ncbi:Cystathionine beta-synthase, core [Corchorus capsularis]|uniref:Cystathionine beta-synthase, core n=1 Tax=Corchorus capsularis TaxID=210143 RepID=A0A1R3I1N5_COCAP|nr:Cystathionine beta-synthase, core [Corchorus capsularis]
MAVSLLAREVSDVCLGKPALRSLSISATVGDALWALKRFGDNYISVWNCDHNLHLTSPEADKVDDECRCLGKVCMVDIICFLCKEENLSNPATAFQAPLSVLIPKVPGVVRHLEPNASLVEAMDLILEGAQNLVIPLETSYGNSRKKLLQENALSLADSNLHNNRQYCWLTQEDIIRYLLNSIGLFCPTPNNPINSLGIIDTQNILAVHYDDPASSALPLISQSLQTLTSVAIVDNDGKFIGEISPFTLNSCDEDVAAAIATLSVGDLMAYIDCGGRPDDLVQLVKERLQERNLEQALELMEEDSGLLSGGNSFSSSCSSSTEEDLWVGRSGRLGGYSARVVRRSEAIVCYPWSSLVAVMIQALAHRVSYVWVVEEDGTLAGIVTFAGMMKVLRERLRSMA